MNNARIIGLDVSSTTIGICILDIIDNQLQLVKYDFYKPSKEGHILERLSKTKKFFTTLFKEYKPTHIAIEDIVSFMRNASTAQTVIVLASFNRMLGLLAYEHLKKMPQMFSVLAIRHGLKLTDQLPAKEEMPMLVEQHLDIKFNYLYNRNNKLRPENFDMADAMAVALHYAFTLLNEELTIKSPKRKTNVKKRSLSSP